MRMVTDKNQNPVYCMSPTVEDKWNKEIVYDTLPFEFIDAQGRSCSSTAGLAH